MAAKIQSFIVVIFIVSPEKDAPADQDVTKRHPDPKQEKDVIKVHWLPMWDYLDLRLVRFFFTVGSLQIFANTSG